MCFCRSKRLYQMPPQSRLQVKSIRTLQKFCRVCIACRRVQRLQAAVWNAAAGQIHKDVGGNTLLNVVRQPISKVSSSFELTVEFFTRENSKKATTNSLSEICFEDSAFLCIESGIHECFHAQRFSAARLIQF